MVALIVGWVLGRATSGGTGTKTAGVTTTLAAPTSTSPATSTTLAPTSIGKTLTANGAGDNVSQPFAFAAGWQLVWSFTCPQGENGQFQVVVLDSTQHPVATDPPISATGRSGTGTQHYGAGAPLTIKITTPCAWSVKLSA